PRRVQRGGARTRRRVGRGAPHTRSRPWPPVRRRGRCGQRVRCGGRGARCCRWRAFGASPPTPPAPPPLRGGRRVSMSRDGLLLTERPPVGGGGRTHHAVEMLAQGRRRTEARQLGDAIDRLVGGLE